MNKAILLSEDEVLDDLLDGEHYIIQNRKLYRFTSDSVRLSKFCNIKKQDVVVELCSGCGIISILLKLAFNPKKIILVELQKELADLSRRSIELNSLTDVIVFNERLQNIYKKIGSEIADAVVVNPPFEKKDAGLVSENESIRFARSEEAVDLQEIVKEASTLLKFGGNLFICIPSKRLFELSNYCNTYNLAIKESIICVDEKNCARLALIKAQKGGKNYANITISKD